MMKSVGCIIVLTLIFVSPSCSPNNGKEVKDLRVIDVAGGVGKSRLVNLSEIADTIEYIPLETSKESLVERLVADKIFYENGIIYISQKSACIKIFDKRGAYINTINRKGRGPQEYEQFWDVDIEVSTGNICVKGYCKILEYTKDGHFVRRITFQEGNDSKGIFLFSFKKLGNFYIMTSAINKQSVYSAFIMDSTSRVIMKLNYPQEEVDFVQTLSRSFSIIDPDIFKYDGSVRLINGNNEYVLSINKNLSIDTAFIINYGKYKTVDESAREPNSPFLSRFLGVFESNSYLFMQFHVGSLTDKPARKLTARGKIYIYPHSCSIFNKKTGEFLFLDQPEINHLGFVEDLEGGPAIWPKYISADNYMISYIPAHEFIAHAESNKVSDKFKQIASKLKETDNPVLVRVKLKSNK
ncbi:MAG: 6-bladed beta-propeller [Bacteroidales bacterium]|jgi:hypothetical protein